MPVTTKPAADPALPVANARKKRGALLVHEQLRDDIMWLRLAPGTALDEVALAARFEVSRTPIREALLLLANEGFVEFQHNRTTLVAPLSLHNHAAFVDTVLLLSRGLARSAALRGAAEHAILSNHVAAFETALMAGDQETAFRAQLDLYREIAALARNQFLAKYFLEAQDASVRTKLLYYFEQLTQEDKRGAVGHLRAVAEAVAGRNADAADDAIREIVLFETAVIQSHLGPTFGHRIEIGNPAVPPVAAL